MLGRRLINTQAGGVCTSDTVDIFDDLSCIALYQFNGNVSDLSGNYNGTVTTAGTYVAGKINLARNRGSNNIPVMGYTSSSAGAVSGWLKYDEVPTQGYSALIGDFRKNGAFGINICASNVPSGFVGLLGIGGTTTNFGALPSAGEWHHIVVSRNASQDYTVYIDGVQSGTTQNVPYTDVTVITPELGRTNNSNIYLLQGLQDQVRFFNRALSSSEVTTLYNEVAC